MGSLPDASHDRVRVAPSCSSCDCGLISILLGATHYNYNTHYISHHTINFGYNCLKWLIKFTKNWKLHGTIDIK